MNVWCEHPEIISKYTTVKYYMDGREVILKVQTWLCPECGVHGSETEVIHPDAVPLDRNIKLTA